MVLKFYFFVLIYLSSNLYAVEYIERQDKSRISAYAQDRDPAQAELFTANISSQLTDHTQIDYSRAATDAEREVIYKAMMGSVIVHGLYSYNKTTTGHIGYDSHFDALQVVDESIRALWTNVSKGTYIDGLSQITNDLTRQALLTPCFVRWFYEALESYKNQLNFFGGTASFDWFKGADLNYRAARKFDKRDHGGGSCATHTYIQNEQGHLIAILKPKKPTEKSDWLVSLSAKATGLIDVINPAIPVHIKGGWLTIDTKDFTHIIEPFVGFSNDQINADSPMGQLLRHVLDANPKQKMGNNALFRLYHFAKYFEHGTNPSDQRFNDLQTFNAAIDLENVVKIILFWKMFEIADMHDSNILLRVKSEGKLSFVVIDYNLCLCNTTQCSPSLVVLKHATQLINSGLRQKINERISYESIKRVYEAYSEGDRLTASRGRYPSVRDRLTLFIPQKLEEFFREGASIRDIIWRIDRENIKAEEERFMRQSGNKEESKLLSFYKKLEPIVGDHINCYWPLDIRPLGEVPQSMKERSTYEYNGHFYVDFPKLMDSTPIDFGHGEYPIYQVRRSCYDWVFSVTDALQLERGCFFKSTVKLSREDMPGLCMWRNGMIPLSELFHPKYVQTLPSD
ncbi:hypothetical protein [Candidatus Finniella inopinata]|uniref:Uncharacterized protein n=1 Tax=Candidatus Finniella inopinata TaxID=1696036 RepID=A0A4Q7DJ73_9PROT|nr:hypothetical protein [Candidatus Finniella inopinata]RZI46390.1 hypothetical protein EQU50_02020 [Candidatus Finniella inopinata]